MSTLNKNRLPVSATNAVLMAVFLAGAVLTAIDGSWRGAVLLSVLSIVILVTALYARRPNSRDITRVNAIEYRDERDKRIAQVGFSVVGVAALIISAVEFVAVTAMAGTLDWPPALQALPAAQLILLCLVWTVANSVSARRG